MPCLCTKKLLKPGLPKPLSLRTNGEKHLSFPFVKAISAPRTIDGLPDVAVRGLDDLDALLSGARRLLKSTGKLHAAARELVAGLDLRAALDDTAAGGESGEQRYWQILLKRLMLRAGSMVAAERDASVLVTGDASVLRRVIFTKSA